MLLADMVRAYAIARASVPPVTGFELCRYDAAERKQRLAIHN